MNNILNAILSCPEPNGPKDLVPVFTMIMSAIDDGEFDIIDTVLDQLPVEKVALQWSVSLLRLTNLTAAKYTHRPEFFKSAIERAWNEPRYSTEYEIKKIFMGIT